jgi:hypothetical protein
MAKCPRCHLEFRSRIYRKVVEQFGVSKFQPDGSWRQKLECGHFYERTAEQARNGVSLSDRRACAECLAAHHKELGV